MSPATTRHGLGAAECEALARLLDWLADEMATEERWRGAFRRASDTWAGRAAAVLHDEARRLKALDGEARQ